MEEYSLNTISLEDKEFADRTVDRLMAAFTENLNIDDMLLCKCLSEQLISDDDVSRIGATLKAGRRCEAVRDLLLRIKRNRNKSPGHEVANREITREIISL